MLHTISSPGGGDSSTPALLSDIAIEMPDTPSSNPASGQSTTTITPTATMQDPVGHAATAMASLLLHFIQNTPSGKLVTELSKPECSSVHKEINKKIAAWREENPGLSSSTSDQVLFTGFLRELLVEEYGEEAVKKQEDKATLEFFERSKQSYAERWIGDAANCASDLWTNYVTQSPKPTAVPVVTM